MYMAYVYVANSEIVLIFYKLVRRGFFPTLLTGATYQDLFGRFRPHHAAEVTKIGRADFSDVEQRIDTQCCKPLQKDGLGHFFSN